VNKRGGNNCRHNAVTDLLAIVGHSR